MIKHSKISTTETPQISFVGVDRDQKTEQK